ncbi:DUF2274 domain-containing protein [Ruegeria sp.]|uniref:DUF2274 domain-containing protein n=1 Tax=Ruegeria sp. TaxID=1879320 RepID=UPI003B009E98
MTNLRLARLPDRTPTRITITVDAELNAALRDYAALYRATYGEDEKVADLIPFMLDAFLASDRAFAKARKEGIAQAKTKTNVAGTHKDGATPGNHARSSLAGETQTALSQSQVKE